MSAHAHSPLNKITLGGLIISLGIIYGDIGTSPLYVMKEILGGEAISRDLVLGGLSCIFWTLTLQTTLKYVVLTLKADNNGEGGIFSLYTLVRRSKYKWLIVPAIIGGSALLADGIITPPISVASAVEGLGSVRGLEEYFNAGNSITIGVVISIIVLLFVFQQFGTKAVGRLFGPIMTCWFIMLGVLGSWQIIHLPGVLQAVNPMYAIRLLQVHPEGIVVLGAVFLCTTGAEALYSDMGHCGRKNIRISWIFVKAMLVLNYFGQGAWLIQNEGHVLSEFGKDANPFYLIMPHWFLIPGVVIATSAAVIASQALITGSYTLINEAMRLNLWPRVRVKYPTDLKGQMYIPSINWLLMFGCIAIVLFFRKSTNMSAAYGLAIVLCMMMTTLLLNFYMHMKRFNVVFIIISISAYVFIESLFLIANLSKFWNGGWFTLLVAGVLISVMAVMFISKKIKDRYIETVKINDFKPVIQELSVDQTIPKYATHLVYLTSANLPGEVETKIVHSILQRKPKRADIYWFVHVDVADDPYRMEYKVTHIAENDIIRIDFTLGFRVAPKINMLFRKVLEDLVANKEVDITSRYHSLSKNNLVGDFQFIVIQKYLSNENDLPFFERIILRAYFMLKRVSVSEERAFGLETSSVYVEKFPLIIRPSKELPVKRVF